MEKFELNSLEVRSFVTLGLDDVSLLNGGASFAKYDGLDGGYRSGARNC